MKIYLVRHGQTDWNIDNRLQGQVDIPLNATGIRQAEELKNKLKNLDFDICYASPLERAKLTAEIGVDGRCKIIFDDDLKERSFGSFEGEYPNRLDFIDILDRKLNSNQGGIEPIRDVLARSNRFLNRLKSENPPDAKILVVGHGVLLKTLHFNIVGYDDDTNFRNFHLENGEIVEHEI